MEMLKLKSASQEWFENLPFKEMFNDLLYVNFLRQAETVYLWQDLIFNQPFNQPLFYLHS